MLLKKPIFLIICCVQPLYCLIFEILYLQDRIKLAWYNSLRQHFKHQFSFRYYNIVIVYLISTLREKKNRIAVYQIKEPSSVFHLNNAVDYKYGILTAFFTITYWCNWKFRSSFSCRITQNSSSCFNKLHMGYY